MITEWAIVDAEMMPMGIISGDIYICTKYGFCETVIREKRNEQRCGRC